MSILQIVFLSPTLNFKKISSFSPPRPFIPFYAPTRATSHLASFSRCNFGTGSVNHESSEVAYFFYINILITDKSGAIINQFAKALAECWAFFLKFLVPVRESDLVPSR